MTLTELRYIVTLADERHFGRAAERCHVSQPTLSVAVRKLEDELKVQLFERSKNNITLTGTGYQICEQARVVLREAAVIRDIALAGRDQVSSPLRVGAIYTIGPYLFPHLMPELRRNVPGMPLYIRENFTHVLGDMLRQSELDAIIVALPFEEPDVVTQPLYDEPFVVLLPADHPLAEFRELDSEQLQNEDLLMLGPGHCVRDQVIEACPDLFQKKVMASRVHGVPGESGTGGHLLTEASSLETIRHMVAGGLGVSVLPLNAAGIEHYPEGLLTVRPFRGPAPFRTVVLAWRASFPRPKAIEALSRAVKLCRIAV